MESNAAKGNAANRNEITPALIGRLADEKVENRYDAQMELQNMASKASTPGNESQRKAFGKALAEKAADKSVPQPARVWIVRQLEYMGRGEAVKSLTVVMNGDDAELRECARRALEKNPEPAATSSLRSALQKADDPARKIGLMNSLGERGDTESVKLIAQELDNPKTAAAAALALGKIGTKAAADALWGSLNKIPEAGEALINVANQLAAKGDDAADAVYRRIAGEAKSKSVVTAAEAGRAKTG
jgi:HEAT repeat protein